MQALVTGAASGIGRATCLRLARDAKTRDRPTRTPTRTSAPTGPSKAALIMLVQVMAQEFGRDGIRVNTVSPRMVRTGMTARVYADVRIAAERDALVPIGRVATPEDIAGAVAFLLGPDARYVNGHDLVVDGGVSSNFLVRLPSLTQITRS